MNAREYLEQLRAIDSKIRVDRELLQEKKMQAAGSRAIRYGKDKIQTSLAGSRLETDVCGYVEFERAVNSRIRRYEDAKEKVVCQIKALGVPAYIEILFKVYVQYKTLKQAKDEMGKSYTFIKEKHIEALNEFERMHKPFSRLA